jgi:hypothetical protein
MRNSAGQRKSVAFLGNVYGARIPVLGRVTSGQEMSMRTLGDGHEVSQKTYQAGQIAAIYREIFTLQTSAGWQDVRDFATWYASRGWSYHRPRDPMIPGAIPCPMMQLHALSEAKATAYRESMQAGKWSDPSCHPIIVMADGEVSDGHHRLAAAAGVDWATVPNRPVFTALFRSDVIPD